MRLLREPVYGELRDVLGATLPVATPNPKCPKAGPAAGRRLPGPGAGRDEGAGRDGGRVLTAPGAGGGAGAVISGPLGQAYGCTTCPWPAAARWSGR
jgi:hypothetical protein